MARPQQPSGWRGRWTGTHGGRHCERVEPTAAAATGWWGWDRPSPPKRRRTTASRQRQSVRHHDAKRISMCAKGVWQLGATLQPGGASEHRPGKRDRERTSRSLIFESHWLPSTCLWCSSNSWWAARSARSVSTSSSFSRSSAISAEFSSSAFCEAFSASSICSASSSDLAWRLRSAASCRSRMVSIAPSFLLSIRAFPAWRSAFSSKNSSRCSRSSYQDRRRKATPGGKRGGDGERKRCCSPAASEGCWEIRNGMCVRACGCG